MSTHRKRPHKELQSSLHPLVNSASTVLKTSTKDFATFFAGVPFVKRELETSLSGHFYPNVSPGFRPPPVRRFVSLLNIHYRTAPSRDAGSIRTDTFSVLWPVVTHGDVSLGNRYNYVWPPLALNHSHQPSIRVNGRVQRSEAGYIER